MICLNSENSKMYFKRLKIVLNLLKMSRRVKAENNGISKLLKISSFYV